MTELAGPVLEVRTLWFAERGMSPHYIYLPESRGSIVPHISSHRGPDAIYEGPAQ